MRQENDVRYMIKASHKSGIGDDVTMCKTGENKGIILVILVWLDFISLLHGSGKVGEE